MIIIWYNLIKYARKDSNDPTRPRRTPGYLGYDHRRRGTLYLPDGAAQEVIDLLTPDTYSEKDDRDLIGVGSLAEDQDVGHVEAAHVHLRNGYAVKSAPFLTKDRLLDWMMANLMLEASYLSLFSTGSRLASTEDINGERVGLRTPIYLGAMAIEDDPFKSLVVMSNERAGAYSVSRISSKRFSQLNTILDLSVRTALMLKYDLPIPEDLDHWQGNWIFNQGTNDIVRLDLPGLTNKPIRLTGQNS